MTSDPEPLGDPARLRLYRELADWYPLLTPVGDYAEEAAFYRRLFAEHGLRPPRTLLDLGCGGGHNVYHLKKTLSCTLVDLAPAMLEVSRRLNPECDHVWGDMRSIRLGCVFDCVLAHDAVSYMASRSDLRAAITTAFQHTAPGGVALFQPDFVSETFAPGTEAGGRDAGGRALRYLEWRWLPGPGPETYVTDMAYVLRDERGAVEVVHDRHVMGLFPRGVWLERIAAAGFEPRPVPKKHPSAGATGLEVFLGRRPPERESRPHRRVGSPSGSPRRKGASCWRRRRTVAAGSTQRALVDRLARVAGRGEEPALLELTLALLRLAPDGRAEALAGARTLTGEPGAAVCYALGDEVEIGPTACLWVAAARARNPRGDDLRVEERHPAIGPYAAVAARYVFRTARGTRTKMRRP